jgi:hypothetical protein
LVRELQRLDDEDPLLAAQATRLVGLYRRLWDSYVARRTESHRLEKENQHLERSNKYLVEENRQMGRQYTEQEAQLLYFRDAFQKVRDGITGIFESWKDVEPELSVPSQRGIAYGNKHADKP